MTDKSGDKRKADPPPASSTNDVTPYYSLQSFNSPLRAGASPTPYQSALSATPQPSPAQRQDQRRKRTRTINLAEIGTATERANVDTGAQTTSSINPFSNTQPATGEFTAQTSDTRTDELLGRAEFGAQTTSSHNPYENTPAGADFAMQTADRTNATADKRIAFEVGAQATYSTTEFGVQTDEPVVESSIAGTSFGSLRSSVDELHQYDKELDPASLQRAKKYTKQRIIDELQLGAESSLVLSKMRLKSSKNSASTVISASLESQAEYDQPYHARNPSNSINKVLGLEDYSSPLTNEMGARSSNMPVTINKVPSKNIPSKISLSTLSSEPNLASGGFPTNLELGNGFLYMIIPPDGGYGWFIVLISFLCQVIVDGIIFSVGILLPHIAEDLGESQTTIVLVASIQVGPVASAFINKFGFRPVALAGSICSIVFILISTYSPNMIMLIVFYSVLGGPSLSLIWVSSQLIIGYYFERYRPIANGVSCSGAGAGILIFSFMNAKICPDIGWRNTSRIHAALLFCVFLMAITFIEVAPKRIATVKKEIESSSSSEDSTVPFSQVRYSQFYESHLLMKTSINRGLEQMFEVYEPKKTTIMERLCPLCCRKKQPAERERDDVQRGEQEFNGDDEHIEEPKKYVLRVDPIEREDLFYTGTAAYDENEAIAAHRRTTGHLILIDNKRAATINYSLSVMRAQRQHHTRTLSIAELRHRHKNPYLAYISPKNWMPSKLYNAFGKLFDMNMLKIMEFRVLLLSAFFFPMGFNIPFVYSKTRAEIHVFHSSLISPTIGISNFVFRILSGFAANKYRSQTTYMCGGGIVFGGLAVLASAFYGQDVVWVQYTYAACYGVAPAFFSTLRAIIYVRTLGLDNLTNAFGLTGLAMGLGVFLGTTTAAILNGWTKHYNAAFAFSGLCLIAAGSLKLMLPTIIRYRTKRLKAELEVNTKGIR